MEAKVPVEIKTKDGLRIEFDLILDKSLVGKLYNQIIKDLSVHFDVPEKFKEPKYMLNKLRYNKKTHLLPRTMEYLAAYMFFKNPRAFKVKGVKNLRIFGKKVRKLVDPEKIQSRIYDAVAKSKNSIELINYLRSLGMVREDIKYLRDSYLGVLNGLSVILFP